MTAQNVSEAAAPRATHDLYHAVLKGLRHAHGRVLDRIATFDPGDREAIAALVATLRAHLGVCRSHLAHEDAEIPAALEVRVPGASGIAAHQHADHERSFAELETMAQALLTADAPAVGAAPRALYRRFALFVADDLEHMDGEEHALQPILQAYFSDAELQAIEHRVVGAIPPDGMVLYLRAMPADAFDGRPPRRWTGGRRRA